MVGPLDFAKIIGALTVPSCRFGEVAKTWSRPIRREWEIRRHD